MFGARLGKENDRFSFMWLGELHFLISWGNKKLALGDGLHLRFRFQDTQDSRSWMALRILFLRRFEGTKEDRKMGHREEEGEWKRKKGGRDFRQPTHMR